MAYAVVSPLAEQLESIIEGTLGEEVMRVMHVEKEVKKIHSNLKAIKAVLADAETRQAKEETVRVWLEELKDVAYDIEDVLDDWKDEIRSSKGMPGDEGLAKKVISLLCSPFKQVVPRHGIANKIKELNEMLDIIAQKKDRYHFDEREGNPSIERPMTTSLIDITEVKGREEDKNVLVEKLVSEPSDGDGSDPRVLSIVGMGGIGKTTLAQYAFNHDRIKAHFGKNKFWVCVSDPFDETRVAKAILTGLGVSTQDVTELEHFHQKIGESIEDKRFLLILDDVWEENCTKWNRLKQSLKFGLPGSKILVTTRNERVASIMGCSKNNILSVKKLSDEECWLIISKIVFFDRGDKDCKKFEEIGREISTKCKGLPLAAKALGGNLLFKRTKEEWKSILDSEIWGLEEAQRDVFAPLWLSYYDLSPALKRCFSYCAIFPKDCEIMKSELIGLWMAQGYLKKGGQSDDMEITGEIYFQNLAMRSFFQDFEKGAGDNGRIFSCKMHDIVHDFAQNIARNEVNGQAESISGSPSSSKVRHLLSDCTDGAPSFNSFDSTKKLRSLLIWGSLNNKLLLTTEDLSRLFSESTHVRSLSLRDGDFAEIPPSIRKLVQLRWLDLFGNWSLKQLPETLCELLSLQTIDVSYCNSQLKLPLGIGKLINLRHLHNFKGPSRLPKGIGQLMGLRTLEEVNVGCGGDAFSLSDLKNLNQLRGLLQITELGKYNRHVGEAEQAELKKKEHITRLNLSFLYYGEERCTPRNEELLLEALEPSPNLEILDISLYRGTTFPGWMISLTNLRSILLEYCQSCEHLPSLGKLPSLETLHVQGMWGVKKVGLELLGIETQIGDRKSEISASSSSSPVVVAFPKLTELKFYFMDSWEEWEDYYDGTTKPPPIIIMPSLQYLDIYGCPELRALPDFILQSTTLHILSIERCDLLEEHYNKGKGEDWSKMSHISHATRCDGRGLVHDRRKL